MMISLLVIFLITASGTVLTYLYEKENGLLARLCAGSIVGSAFFGSLAFLLACVFGLGAPVLLLSLFGTFLSFVLLAGNEAARKSLKADLLKAVESLKNADPGKTLRFAYYSGLLLLLYFFFDRAMIETGDGIFTGSTHNYGDLSFHLGAIFSFAEGDNFPPENPSFAGAKFTYPFLADFLTACLVKLGSGVRDAMHAQNVTFAFSLFVLFEEFARALTKNRLAGKLSVVILLFCGGLGFLIFFCDYLQDGRSFFDFLWHLPADYTIRQTGFRWGNSLTTLFITQRSMLLGIPVTLIALTAIWRIFSGETGPETYSAENNFMKFGDYFPAVFVGLLAGTLPLIHVHSLLVLFIVSAFLLCFSPNKWRQWAAFAIAVAVVAVPELLWMMTGSLTRFGEFIGWHFGWSAGEENIFLFWFKNSGLFIPLLIMSLTMFYRRKNEEIRTDSNGLENRKPKAELIFYTPFVFIFAVSHLVRLAPYEWDNIKVLIYWFLCSAPFAAWGLAVLWEKKFVFKLPAAGGLLILTFSGALDVWRVASGQININFFERDALLLAEQIRRRTPPGALFLNAPVYNTAVVLSGRRSLMRFSAHVASYGIDYKPREDDLKRIYEGSALSERLLEKYGIEYVIIGPREKELEVDKKFFEKYPVIAESGLYRVYQIKK